MRLSDDPLKAFQNLPNLAKLILEMEAYNGEQLQIRKGGFPKLRASAHRFDTIDFIEYIQRSITPS